MVLLTVIFWPITALLRRHYQHPLDLSADQKRSRLVERIVCLLFLVLFVGWITAISQIDDISALNGLPKWIIILSLLGIVCAIGTIPVVMSALRNLRAPGLWVWTKLHGVLLALGCIGLVWFLFTWKFMNFNTHF